ncbi:MAG: hypothetical protein PHT07_10200 [Paludibacter sp.]|nr:hypothetical protein [Paludibacter sp.]
MRPKTKAKQIKRIVLAAAGSTEPSEHFGRSFDDLLECGDVDKVVKEFVKIYHADDNVKEAVHKVDGWIGIDNWIRKAQCDLLPNI